jgi:hypothetical protein
MIKMAISMGLTVVAVIVALVIYKKMDEFNAKKLAEKQALAQAQLMAAASQIAATEIPATT